MFGKRLVGRKGRTYSLHIISVGILFTFLVAQNDCGIMFEDFESGTIPPGWVLVDGSGDGYVWNVGTTSNLEGFYPPYYGNYYAYFDDYIGCAPSDPDALQTPPIDISGLAQLWLYFSIGTYYATEYDSVVVRARFDGGSWIKLKDYDWHIAIVECINLSDYLPADTVEIRWEYWDDDYWDAGVVGIDNVCLTATPPPPCPPEMVELVQEFDFNVSTQGFINTSFSGCADAWWYGPLDFGGSQSCEGEQLVKAWATGSYWYHYPSQAGDRIISPPLTIGNQYWMEICHWYNVDLYDGGNVKVSTDSGETWEVIYPCDGYPYFMDSPENCFIHRGQPYFAYNSNGWIESWFNLSRYEGEEILIAFDFGSDWEGEDIGWAINWVNIWRTVPTISEEKRELNHFLFSKPKPSPFREETELTFYLPAPKEIKITVFDLSGRKVRTLLEGRLEEGKHSIHWRGRDDAGTLLPAGTYFIKIQTDELSTERKVVYLR